MRDCFAALCLGAALVLPASAQVPASTERQAILDATRPVAQSLAQQSVRIKVDRLNVDSGWAVLVGELVTPTGGKPDWTRAAQCDANLDAMLWVVLAKADGRWRVAQIEVCAPEPPYWYLQQLTWPCGVYAGLQRTGAETIEAECRRAQSVAPR